MEVRIGVRQVAREVAFDSDQTPEDVLTAVSSAVASGAGVLQLVDDRGRTIVVPVDAIGYVEIGGSDKGRVGFGAT